MAIKITSPTQQGVQVGGLPYSLAVTAIADSNINTDVRFKLNGAVVGVDTNATNIGTTAFPQYQYGLTILINNAGINEIEVEDITDTQPILVRSTDKIYFEVKANVPAIVLNPPVLFSHPAFLVQLDPKVTKAIAVSQVCQVQQDQQGCRGQ